ncbi:helix-turn-helix domain-containing protein [Altericroceibacterium endophyticum]|uniref:Helix-turn-helix domain-containing protein n=1 Tax=Altericroceibacterium endophyticum TaxID=1808508 RepID=A0A6I4T3S6_9SPHN|nr:helix-turn-helix domain-containing protein [Altericroceibacterium endophyticum]
MSASRQSATETAVLHTLEAICREPGCQPGDLLGYEG